MPLYREIHGGGTSARQRVSLFRREPPGRTQGKNGKPHPTRIYRNQGPGLDCSLLRPQSFNDQGPHLFRARVFASQLDDTGSACCCRRQQCAKIQVVCEHNMPVTSGPFHDLRIRSCRCTNFDPVLCFPALKGKHPPPLRGQVHIQQNFHRTAGMGSSRSPARQDPYASAAERSAASR